MFLVFTETVHAICGEGEEEGVGGMMRVSVGRS